MTATDLLGWVALAALLLVWIGGTWAAAAAVRDHGRGGRRSVLGYVFTPFWPLLIGYALAQRLGDSL